MQKWINLDTLEDAFKIIHTSFRGWIFNNMHSAFMYQDKENEVKVLIYFYSLPNEKEIRIIESEIKLYIVDSLYSVRFLNEVNFMFKVYDDEQVVDNEMICIFEKYIYRDYDWEI